MRVFILVAVIFELIFAKIDINSASVEKLISLKGIGIMKAQAIIRYREKHCFKKVDELMQIKGIGKKTIEKNTDDIIIGKCK